MRSLFPADRPNGRQSSSAGVVGGGQQSPALPPVNSRAMSREIAATQIAAAATAMCACLTTVMCVAGSGWVAITVCGAATVLAAEITRASGARIASMHRAARERADAARAEFQTRMDAWFARQTSAFERRLAMANVVSIAAHRGGQK